MRIISGIARGTKLYTLDDKRTRPTLDRVKEPLFSIIQTYLKNSVVLDLFSGSGALALEALSRGASRAVLCDKSHGAINIIKKNIEKTHMDGKTKVYCLDYKKCIATLKEKFDIIFLDPPYELNLAVKSVELILQNDILSEEGIIVIETDDAIRELKNIEKLNYNIAIIDQRTYGRVKLIFLKKEERG